MHSPSHNASDASLKAGYEVSDMKPSIILVFFVALLILMFSGIALGLIFLRGVDASRAPMVTTPVSALAPANAQIPAQKPYLQSDPVTERHEIFKQQQTALDTFGWVSRDAGQERARLPIFLAMQRLAQGEVPYRQTPQIAVMEEGAPEATEEAHE